MSVPTIKRNEEFKWYSVMGEKSATATCDTHRIVLMMFRRNHKNIFPPEQVHSIIVAQCCLFVECSLSVEIFSLFLFSFDSNDRQS